MPNEIQKGGNTHPIPALFEHMGIEKVTPKDKFTLEYSSNFLSATIKRASGKVEVVRMHTKQAGFSEMSVFEPTEMTKAQRDEIVHKLKSDGLSQSKIAQRLGISQANVSNILRK